MTRLAATREGLLEKMKKAARSAGLEEVEIWNLNVPKDLDGLEFEGEGNEDSSQCSEVTHFAPMPFI